MKVNKGVGPNSIPTKILKDYKSELSKPLRDMINTSFTTGIFPSALKVANIIPIHKKVDKLDCNNYQPISLLSNISKIFEKIRHIEIQFLRNDAKFLNKNKVLSSFQFGFWNKHSTHHSLISLTKMIQSAFETFAEGYLMFFSICLGKKNAEVIKFQGISKNMSPKMKYILVQERKAIFCLIKLFLSFTQFSNLIS